MAIISEIQMHPGYPRKYNVQEDLNQYLYVDILQADRCIHQIEVMCESLEEAKIMYNWTDAEWDVWFNATDKPEPIKG